MRRVVPFYRSIVLWLLTALAFIIGIYIGALSALGQTADELQTTVTYLTSTELQGRGTSSRGIKKAQESIISQCKEAGLRVQTQEVRTSKGLCQNVIAWVEGIDPTQVVIVGAHLDHVGTRRGKIYPGADDNASGSAAVLGLAKRFAVGPQPEVTISFQWYTGEEIDLLGSAVYAKSPLLPEGAPAIDQHILMLNLDMIGHLKPAGPIDVQFVLDDLFPKYPFASQITFRRDSGSDQVSFDDAGVPVVFLHTGTDFGTYHTPADTADTLNYGGMELICEYAFEIVNQMAAGKVPDHVIWDLPVITIPQ